jgi:hypothetical protein
MIRKLFQSALCICLSPLLIAQQTAQSAAGQTSLSQIHIDLTGDAGVRFLTPRPDLLGTVESGDLVQFVPGEDITSGDAVLLHAGVPVAGVIAQVKRSSRFHHRDGEIFINVTELVSGKMTEIVVRCTNPADKYVASASPHGSMNAVHAIAYIALVGLIFVVLYGATHHTDG